MLVSADESRRLFGVDTVPVVTQFKLQARKSPQEVWGGNIFIPRTQLDAVVTGILAMDSRPPNPKVAFYLFMMRKEQLAFLHAKEDMLMIQAFDALGEIHGRSADGFRWAFECPGAIDTTKVSSLSGLAKLQGLALASPEAGGRRLTASLRAHRQTQRRRELVLVTDRSEQNR